MKKIAFLLAFVLTVSAGFSQQRKKMRKADNMSTEQRTTLTVKRLTLALDLTKDQANKVSKLYSKMAKARTEKGMKMRKKGMEKREKLMKIKKASKDGDDFKKRVKKAVEKGELKKEDLAKSRRKKGSDFESQNQALDNMIAHQSEMKKILTKEQFAKYKKMQKSRVKRVKIAKEKTARVKKMKGKMKKRGKGKRQK